MIDLQKCFLITDHITKDKTKVLKQDGTQVI